MASDYGNPQALTLRPIDADNFWDIIGLEVADGQQDFVLSNAVSIAQARVQPECVPLAIYNGNTPVGFVMYCLDRDDDEYWIYRLMIDQVHQGKGLAKTAMRHVLREIALDRSRDKVFLGVQQDNENAVELYQKLGFRFDGRVFGHEHVMVLPSLEPFRERQDGKWKNTSRNLSERSCLCSSVVGLPRFPAGSKEFWEC